MAFNTALQILNQCQAELGLATTAVTGVTDKTGVRLLALLNKACRRLARYDWSALTIRYSFSPGLTSPYTLPVDYRSMVPQSGWDVTMRWPLVGPLTEQQWELYVARLGLGNAAGVPFRTWQNALYLYPTTAFPAGRTIAFEYRSLYWCQSAPATAPSAETATLDADIVWFDAPLAVAATILEWKRSVGEDSTAAQQDFDMLFQQAQDSEADAPILSLGKSLAVSTRLIGTQNLPDTGYGS